MLVRVDGACAVHRSLACLLITRWHLRTAQCTTPIPCLPLPAAPPPADSPPITLVIVQKRHNTRLFPMPQDQQNRDRSGNVLPGTVVDGQICHPFEFE